MIQDIKKTKHKKKKTKQDGHHNVDQHHIADEHVHYEKRGWEQAHFAAVCVYVCV